MNKKSKTANNSLLLSGMAAFGGLFGMFLSKYMRSIGIDIGFTGVTILLILIYSIMSIYLFRNEKICDTLDDNDDKFN